MSDILDQIRRLPTVPGVYSIYDAAGELLYVGKSVNLRTRVRSYFGANGGHSFRTERLKDEAIRVEVQICGSELEALLAESRLIKGKLPPYNVMGRGYRHFPFIKIPDEPFPRVVITRDLVDDGGTYFGPFSSESRAREALDALRPLYRWRSCAPLTSRGCLEHDIGRCSAPCIGAISPVGYQTALAALADFLSGGGASQLAAIELEMVQAAEALRFERARVLRDRLSILRPLVQRQAVLQAAIAELDCLVVLPAATAGRSLWLLVRRGRLVHSERDVTASRRRTLDRRLARALAAPPPGLTVRQEELDELNIMASWLFRHRADGQAIGLGGRPLSEAIADGLALAATWSQSGSRATVAKAVAERAPERRLGPPL